MDTPTRFGASLVIVGAVSCATTPPAPARPDDMFSEAEAYERFMGRWSRMLAPMLIDLAEIRDGDAVLDVGTGTGALALAVRDTTGAARVVGIDPSEGYVRHAAQRGDGPTIHFQVGDGQALGFADAEFDRTLSLLVVNFIPDRERALREMIRVTKPGGVVAAAVWDYAEGMEMLRVFWDEVVAMDPASAPRDEANMPLCRRGELAAAWRRAGLDDVREAPLVITMRFASWEDYWAPFRLGQGPAGAYVAQLSPERQAELARRIQARLLPGGDGPFELRARAWAVRGTRP